MMRCIWSLIDIIADACPNPSVHLLLHFQPSHEQGCEQERHLNSSTPPPPSLLRSGHFTLSPAKNQSVRLGGAASHPCCFRLSCKQSWRSLYDDANRNSLSAQRWRDGILISGSNRAVDTETLFETHAHSVLLSCRVKTLLLCQTPRLRMEIQREQKPC